MESSNQGRNLVLAKVREVFGLSTKKEAEEVLAKMLLCIEDTLVENLDKDGFFIKLNSLGKISIKHTPSILRTIPFTGELKQIPEKRKVKFLSLGRLRRMSKKPE